MENNQTLAEQIDVLTAVRQYGSGKIPQRPQMPIHVATGFFVGGLFGMAYELGRSMPGVEGVCVGVSSGFQRATLEAQLKRLQSETEKRMVAEAVNASPNNQSSQYDLEGAYAG